MPVYGVEDYVAKAIESILAQTFRDYEFLIVDDGSPDQSGAICDRYAAKDTRLTVFHNENQGAPAARNFAIERARGDYLYFMDSDDWAEPTMLEDMVSLAKANDAQLVVTGFYIDTYYDAAHFVTEEKALPSRVFASQREFRENAAALFDRNLLYTPWNKLYSGAYIREHRLRFPQTFWDDFPFNLSVLRDVERVVLSENKYYHFIRASAESDTARYHAGMYDKREEEHGWMVDLYRHWGVDDEQSREFLARRYVERMIGCIENVTTPACTLSPKEKRAEIRHLLTSERLHELLPQMKPRSAYMRLLLVPVRHGDVYLTYLAGRCISKVKSGNVKLFATLKANR